MMSQKHHYVWADVVRSLAIFLVVYIHCRTTFETVAPISWILGVVYLSSTICIALFILLSGALLLPKQEKISIFIRKRLFKILIPWIFWTLLWFIFDYSLILQHSYNFIFIARAFIKYFFSRFWFLPIIFSMYLFTPILRIYLVKLKTKILTVILLLWFFSLILFPIYLLYQGIYNAANTILTIFQFLGIYILGYIIIDRYNPAKYLSVWLGLFLIGTIAIYIQLQLWHKIAIARLAAFPYSFISPEVIIASVSAFIAIYIIFNKIKINNSLTKILSNISHAALGIYLTHEFFILLCYKLLGFSYIPLEKTIIVFFTSCIFVIILNKIPYVKLLVP